MNTRFHSECSLASCNVQIDSDNFVNFDQVKNLPYYRMKFEWDNKHTLEWTQQPNPLSVSNARDINPCKNNGCTTSGSATTYRFAGLSLSTMPIALLDGTTDNNHWYYAVGTSSRWGVNIPAWPPSGSATLTQLYVCVGTAADCPPGPVVRGELRYICVRKS